MFGNFNWIVHIFQPLYLTELCPNIQVLTNEILTTSRSVQLKTVRNFILIDAIEFIETHLPYPINNFIALIRSVQRSALRGIFVVRRLLLFECRMRNNLNYKNVVFHLYKSYRIPLTKNQREFLQVYLDLYKFRQRQVNERKKRKKNDALQS